MILGIEIGFFLAVVVALPVGIYRSTKGYHDRKHQTHSELMCDYCTTRYFNNSPEVNERRWPRRIIGCRPEVGTG